MQRQMLAMNLTVQIKEAVNLDEDDGDFVELPLRTLAELEALEASLDLHPHKQKKLVRMSLLMISQKLTDPIVNERLC